MTVQTAEAVVCANVTKTYGSGDTQVQALRGVDLRIHEGELLMLVGPSGCGKTTLISIFAAVLDADGGELNVLGNDLRAMDSVAKTKFRADSIGFVFQAFNLLPTLTAAENTAVPLLIRGVPKRQALAAARETLDRVGLGSRTHSLPSQLSGGQQQRVAIARALIHRPRLIVCDEPTSALDHTTGAKAMELFRSIALQEGRTLIIVTHDNRIFGFADRIARMDDGRIVEISENHNSHH